MDNSTISGSAGELKEESNLIIYIIGLILLIIWKVTDSDVSSAPTFETQTIGGAGPAAAINRIHHLSSRSNQSSAVRMSGGVQTLRNVSAYNEPTWHFDAQFVDKQATR